MALEIERKFLVTGDQYLALAISKKEIAQGYLSKNIDATIRVRIAGSQAWLTVKSRNEGVVRHEWEYVVPLDDAREMLALCSAPVEKTRYIVPYAGKVWEVDVFHGTRSGLVVAEVELPSEDDRLELPPFVGEEVTGDPAYYNSNL